MLPLRLTVSHMRKVPVPPCMRTPICPLVACTESCEGIHVLVHACHARGFEVAVETNGTRPVPDTVDWVCVSPKPRSERVQHSGQELKLVFPQAEPEMAPEHFAGLAFDHFYLQPLDGPHRQRNTDLAIAYCLRHPQWRLSVQTHKFTGIP